MLETPKDLNTLLPRLPAGLLASQAGPTGGRKSNNFKYIIMDYQQEIRKSSETIRKAS